MHPTSHVTLLHTYMILIMSQVYSSNKLVNILHASLFFV
jgi:hypothetical protein